MRFSDANSMKRADELAINQYKISSLALMERAAKHLFDAADELLCGVSNKRIAVFCGSGNNGGDGLAVARMFYQAGAFVRVFLTGNQEKMTKDSRVMLSRLSQCGIVTEDYDEADDGIASFCKNADLIVDAIVGIGLHLALREKPKNAVHLINESPAKVISADIPSGVEADTGRIFSEAVKADVTVTFSCAKPGHVVEPGCVCAGKLRVVSIGIPKELITEALLNLDILSSNEVKDLIPHRAPVSHKGDYGKILIIGGSRGYTGAPVLAAKAASKTGAGLVWAGVPACVYPIIAAKCDEVMPFPLPDDSNGSPVDGGRLISGASFYIREKLQAADVCVLGPGMGRSDETTKFVLSVLEKVKIPLILDADALYAVSSYTDMLSCAGFPVILTPHEGEFIRLGGDVEALGRLKAAQSFAQKHHVILVLKGHRTIIAAPDGRTYVNTTGNAGMAKGGSGDVLSGMIAALIGQGQQPFEAAAAAVWMHGAAGDLAAEKFGQYSMTPLDTLESIAGVYQRIFKE